MENKEKDNKYRNGMVHFILVHSYLVYLFSVILGVIFDTFLSKKIFDNIAYHNLGFFLIIIGSIFVFWAQRTSGKKRDITKDENPKSWFEHGPYRYSRSPTHLGLFVMTLGLSLLLNSLFSVIFTFIAYMITKIFFLKKEEDLLEKKYGEVYSSYRKKVKNWI